MSEPSSRVYYNTHALYQLPANTTMRELGVMGRTFITDKTPGRIWHGTTLCTVNALDMPVEVFA
ncbi:hypothetical protein QNA24_30010 [Rhodococcus qingshengii]|uniref:hypothetical protein n=1 Tax=Rhodococcus TaxID=1827 RepID=UPI001E2D76B5|nr:MULTISPECIES: hypothetical protein [Rhodococcus]MCD2099605.1 hypothetical protein [Rhodococcus rhodochrous]MCD2123973.1 hypothetical protein [Rhodococcus rhodochrous]MCQ4136595.1 hypothetical protein [Rhodococcus rhodochrous]MDJ0490619.1 hypothetical protein [Rhodococcus qingshengii]